MNRTELGVDYSETYTYDDGDNVLQCTYPTGRVVNYVRDGVRRVSAISSNGNAIINNMSYRGDWSMTNRTWSNGITERRTYDQQARLLQIDLGNLGIRDYQYDASSNITRINSPFHNGVYDYDLNDRLVQESLNSVEQTGFTYDLNDNRLRKLIEPQQGQNAQQNDQQYRYQSDSNHLLSTDRVGDIPTNELVTADQDLVHNDADRIRSVSEGGELVATYIYNDIGLRSRKIVSNQDGSETTTIYHYNMYGSLIAETSELGETQREYIWNGMEPVAQVDVNGVTNLHSDHLYTPRLGTDSTQASVWQWESPAFGNAEPQVEAVEVNLRFPGQYADAESNLYYNWNRYYDPQIGRYVTSDPIGLGGGYNTYGYVEANPLVYYDPYGLQKRKWFDLGNGYRGGLDTFNFKNEPSFEIHVYDPKGKEVGLYGPRGWFDKHGLTGKPANIPDSVENQCRSTSIEYGRRAKLIPKKGKANIKGNNWQKFFKAGARVSPAGTILFGASRLDRVCSIDPDFAGC